MRRRRPRPRASRPRRNQSGRRPVVWLVAVAATLEATGQAMDAFFGGNGWATIRWVAIAILVFVLAGLAENLKVFQER